MAKLETIPTTAQAKYLSALNDNLGLTILWPGKGTAAWSGPGWVKVKKSIGAPRVSTIRKLNREGWIYTPVENSFYSLSPEGLEALDRFRGDERAKPKIPLSMFEITKALHTWLEAMDPGSTWVMISELPVEDTHTKRFIDLFAICIEPTGAHLNNWRISFEIKQSRADLLTELKDLDKRIPSMAIANQFYFVTPVGIAKPEEIPMNCGLIEISQEGVHVLLEASAQSTDPPTWLDVARILRIVLKDFRARRVS